ncbi:tRNA (guanine(10)-N(2))-dimethyltransferase [Candidatus Woesearchaeota archaeon]|nr:tRNA (guanine(10)-N(2))-dimethyltransferase [Candidatus Woesearchaeota archaeon]
MELISEGKSKFKAYLGKVSKKLPVFYNPEMKGNRDISVSLLNALDREMDIALPLAGSGVRGIRFLLECKNMKVHFNDLNPKAYELIRENLELNNVKGVVSNLDADLFLLNSKGFDYIDIDPFGSPNFFLDSAIKRIARNGILGVTATDTSSLAGTFIKTCQRKYWAKPLHNYLMHEVGIRILIRKVQLIGAQYEKALTPIFSHSTKHYMRVYFMCEKGKQKADAIIRQHGEFEGAGPIWLGQLWDNSIVEKMELGELSVIQDEAKIDVVGFYDVHAICKKLKKRTPTMDLIFKEVKKKGYKICFTHFSRYGVKTDMPIDEFINIFINL